MAQYKVIQDVEAEDKFVGPFTFKQFLFALAAMVLGYIMFFFVSSGFGLLAIPIAPFFLGLVAFMVPWTKDQPTELFLASRIRFLFMKRKRLWDQSGVRDLVQITVPKKEVHYYSDGLPQDQVRSRMSALTTVVDSRGWAVKNVSKPSDRLVQGATPTTQQTAEDVDLARTSSMLDVDTKKASEIDQKIKNSENQQHKHALDLVAEARQKSKQNSTSVLDKDESNKSKQYSPPQPTQKTTADTAEAAVKQDPLLHVSNQEAQKLANMPLPQVQSPTQTQQTQPAQPAKPVMHKNTGGPTPEDQLALLDNVHKKQEDQEMLRSQTHLKTIQPLSEQQPVLQQPAAPAPEPTHTSQVQNQPAQDSKPRVNPDILPLARNNDRTVESLSREANDKDSGEVVISLH